MGAECGGAGTPGLLTGEEVGHGPWLSATWRLSAGGECGDNEHMQTRGEVRTLVFVWVGSSLEAVLFPSAVTLR
jgi:hypothetical protein